MDFLKMNLLFWCFASCLIVLMHQCEATGGDHGLVFVQMLYRHGDRNALISYPNDIYGNLTLHYPEGLGQLTKIGRQQQHELGKFIRTRYHELITKNGGYNEDNICVRSTKAERCVDSAKWNLMGMFDFDFEPEKPTIKIEIVPRKDHVLSANRQKCIRFDEELAKAKEEQKGNLTYYAEYLKNLGDITGMEVPSFCTVFEIYDNLHTNVLHGRKLPKWAKDEYEYKPGCLMEKLGLECFKRAVKTRTMIRLRSGFLIKEILDHFTDKKNSTLNPNRSLRIYSAHDQTIIAVLSALKLYEPHFADYASCLFFELHKSNGEYHIELYYKRNHNNSKLEQLEIPNCSKKCPLDKWYTLYEDIIPTMSFDEECGNPKPTSE